MEPSKPPDSKDATTNSHDSASKMSNNVESSPAISSQGQTSSTENDQAMVGQPRNDNGDEQQPQPNDIDDQQPRSDASANSASNQQPPPNQIANVAHCLEAQQQQLPFNDFNPPIPMNERQLNGPFDRPPQVGPPEPPLNRGREIDMDPDPIIRKTPHFHFIFGGQEWTYNDLDQKVEIRQGQVFPVIEREQLELQLRILPPPPLRVLPPPPLRVLPPPPLPELPPPPMIQQHIGINECHRLLMNSRRTLAFDLPRPLPSNDVTPSIPMNGRQLNGLFDQPPYLMPALPPLVSRREVEPGIFEEIYSHRAEPYRARTMFGRPRCMCQDLVHYNRGNGQMITVIMNTPNLSQRFSMTTYRLTPFVDLFKAYHGFTRQPRNAVFVAGGKRLRPYETPISIGMKDRDNIYVFLAFRVRRSKNKCSN
ncbi:histone-lysine N-methyltransferase SETD1B-like [Myzus persicae]|uniref:histone-lysine N-methyltransferase SETD1B-like n=1 Tax=Myzus persicae TaxID=13164 RepID=UPI000B935692|nr:histone-lysine N-methyltransferase SETD1B-like [Myzus persicae]